MPVREMELNHEMTVREMELNHEAEILSDLQYIFLKFIKYLKS